MGVYRTPPPFRTDHPQGVSGGFRDPFRTIAFRAFCDPFRRVPSVTQSSAFKWTLRVSGGSSAVFPDCLP